MKRHPPSIQFLLALELFGIKTGLRNIRRLLSHLGNPERQYPVVHIAGTNGKGSTAAMIAAVLTAAGYRTGLYTSPHLITFHERIRVSGITIADEALEHWTKTLRPVIERSRATFFEATTAIAFAHFAHEAVDIAVVETGLGGRLDATNVVDPLVSVITAVARDHEEYLGHTIASITREKAGIIKPNRPCVIGYLSGESREIIEKIARKRHAKLLSAEDGGPIEVVGCDLSGLTVRTDLGGSSVPHLKVDLAGQHQVRNIACALWCIEVMKEDGRFPALDYRVLQKGFSHVRTLTGFRGRLDVLQDKPLVIADVAHNPDGTRNMVAALEELFPPPCVSVFGVMKDKNFELMLDSLTRVSREIIVVKPAARRSLEPAVGVRFLHDRGISAFEGGSTVAGYRLAMERLRVGESILITGSHHTVGEIMEFMGIST